MIEVLIIAGVVIALQTFGTIHIFRQVQQGDDQTGIQYITILIVSAWSYYFELLRRTYRWLFYKKEDL